MMETDNRFDINHATLEELQQIPGIGPTIADRIIAARPFSDIDDLQRVSGIGEAFLESLRPHITLSSTVMSAVAAAPSTSASDQVPEVQTGMAGDREFDAQQTVEPIELEAIPAPEAQSKEIGASAALPEEDEQLVIDAEIIESTGDQPAPVLEAAAEQEQPQEPPARPPEKQAPYPSASAAAGRTQTYTRNQTLGLTLGASVLTLIISVIAILGILLLVNGGISYVRPGELTTLRRQVNALEAQASVLEQDQQGLRNRLQNLEALSGRVNTLEGNLEQMQGDVSTATKKIAEFEQQINTLDKQIEELRANTSRFQTFLEGLRSLLGDVFKP